MSKASRVPDYLGHILEAIERIEDVCLGLGRNGFLGQ